MLWFFGLHFVYLGMWGLFVLYVVVFFFVLPYLVWWIVEAFKLNGRLRDQRADAAIAALRASSTSRREKGGDRENQTTQPSDRCRRRGLTSRNRPV